MSLLMASFQSRRTNWLAIVWIVIFTLAVSLLIGLLVSDPSCPQPTLQHM
jgi:hypothetical protein